MKSTDFVHETAIGELTKELPSLAKHDYNTIDRLMKRVARKHRITDKALHDLFKRKYKRTPDSWIKDKLQEIDPIESDPRQDEVNKFADWACGILGIQNKPEIELSQDTEEAQENHHTGGHTPGEGSIWVYAKNRNLVDLLRTVFHELVHVRQGEKGMIKPGDSYPGSPIEVQADALAGKYIKIYGEKNHHIFEMVTIPIGRGRRKATTKVLSTMYHNLRGRSLGPMGQIQGYALSPKEIELQDLWAEPSVDGYVWLSPHGIGRDSLQIDMRKLDPNNLRYTGQSEGYVLHRGSIPEYAIHARGKDENN